MSNKAVIDAKAFLKKNLYYLINISGHFLTDLMPANIDNFHLRDKGNYSDDIKQAENVLYCVALAIRDCKEEPRKPYRTILIDLYLKDMLNLEVQQEIGYSRSRYNAFKRQALQDFTQRFNYYAVQEGISSLIELS
ncbi:hypothetical protein [Lactobacillus amylovorus]|uniref:hypothetical protein n=1 Tax=Lactobacillus amylovorus TaxID=1604 RepID=UPI0022E46B8B|nr:hypothetical protein [Lactobacillus amylovorus]